MTIRLIRLPVTALLLLFVLGAGFPLSGQNRRNDNSRFYNGAHQGARGDNRYRNNQGGIGPGKGALIGGAGGAALGAIFGGGVKGTLITGAQKRDLILPDDATVGKQFGDYIETQAKTDHDQLLYSIVDRAVRKYGTKSKSWAAVFTACIPNE